MRTAPDVVGVEWVYPVGRDPRQRIGLAVETAVDGRPCRTRAEFDAIGLRSRYHTASIVSCDWQTDGVHVVARCCVADDDALCLDVSATNAGLEPRTIPLRLVGRVDAGEGWTAAGPLPVFSADGVHVVLGCADTEMHLVPGEQRRLTAVLARGGDITSATYRARVALASAPDTFARLLGEDARFADRCPVLGGDWPAHWREGLHHDFQTTRLLVQPPGGIFHDVWPAWMVAWPRVVLAEGVLDMQRLAYADPELAQRAVLSLFRDAPMPNVPCVFRRGEYNMVAADNSRCGTSPAWCLPFLNLELLYLRSVDRRWLGEVYPYASAYLKWWLAQRVDADGWLVYKCTWESGEDGNPRLDPTGSGDADISGRIRPVELQATMAHAAGVMAFFASELGLRGEEWQELEADYRQRTRRLFDPRAGRFRDWLIEQNKFQDPCPDTLYWGVEACRSSAQSLTPLLIGEPLAADEVWRHAVPPWTLWPSWTTALVESAAAAGHYTRIGELAYETVDRVYRVTTRRELGSLQRPLPGSSPEFWPMDWRGYGGSDAYGWGATTANLLIRHLVGFKESRQTDGWVAELTPALPLELLEIGGRYGINRLNYRGLSFDLAYVAAQSGLLVDLALHDAARGCVVERLDERAEPDVIYADTRSLESHQFPVQTGGRYRIRLS